MRKPHPFPEAPGHAPGRRGAQPQAWGGWRGCPELLPRLAVLWLVRKWCWGMPPVDPHPCSGQVLRRSGRACSSSGSSPGGCLQLDLFPRLPHLLRLAPPRPALFMSLVLLQALITSFLDSGSSCSVTTPRLRNLSKTETRPCHSLVSGPSQAPDCPQGGIHLPYSNMHGPPDLTAPFPGPSACSCALVQSGLTTPNHALSHVLALIYCPSVRGDGELISGLCVSPGWSWGSLCCFGARPTIL